MAFWENPQKTLRLLQLRKDLSRDQQCMVEVSLNTVQSIVNGHWNDVGLGKAQEIASTLMNESSPRLVHSGVIISHAILLQVKSEDGKEDFLELKDFKPQLDKVVEQRLEDPDARLREAIAHLLGVMCSVWGVCVYEKFKQQLLRSILDNLERENPESTDLSGLEPMPESPQPQERESNTIENTLLKDTSNADNEVLELFDAESSQEEREALSEHNLSHPCESHTLSVLNSDSNLRDSFRSSTPVSQMSGASEVLHDTEGWRSLETSMKALVQIIRGCGQEFFDSGHVDEQLWNLLETIAPYHLNRFVREAVYFALAEIISIFPETEFLQIASKLAKTLSKGMEDNWSQVRFASSTTVRAFYAKLQNIAHKIKQDTNFQWQVLRFHQKSEDTLIHEEKSMQEETVLDNGWLDEFLFAQDEYLIPRMVLNRHYVAEGVKLYSQETWSMFFCALDDTNQSDYPEKRVGVHVVSNHINAVVEFYVAQCDADNHAVREAACHCIAELAQKISPEVLFPHVPTLLEALIGSFQDESWPVRDAASVACGLFVGACPEASREALPKLYELWWHTLTDNMASVRNNTAMAISRVVEAYGQEALSVVIPKLRILLPKVHDQPVESSLHGSLSNETRFGVAKRITDNDVHRHTDQPMYSCGSLAPKLKKRASGGCMNCSYDRDPEPWESSDGSVYLLRHLAVIVPESIPEFLPQLAELAEIRHFTHAMQLQQTIWTQLPDIFEAIGKRPTKQHVQPFLEPMFWALEHGSSLVQHAVAQCIKKVERIMGPSIFQGRLTDNMQSLMPLANRLLMELTSNLTSR